MSFAIRKTEQPYYVGKSKPKKNGPYLAFLHELPCCVTGAYGVQAAHVSFPNTWFGAYGRGKGTKVPDLFALPVSPAEHDLQHSGKIGSEEDFWASKGINPHELALTLFGIYSNFEEDEAIVRATARINQGLASAGRLRERIMS